MQAARSEGAQDVLAFPPKQHVQQFMNAGEEWWIVWSGVSTGVLTEEEFIRATCSYHSPDMQGTFLSKGHTLKLYQSHLQSSWRSSPETPVKHAIHTPAPTQVTLQAS